MHLEELQKKKKGIMKGNKNLWSPKISLGILGFFGRKIPEISGFFFPDCFHFITDLNLIFFPILIRICLTGVWNILIFQRNSHFFSSLSQNSNFFPPNLAFWGSSGSQKLGEIPNFSSLEWANPGPKIWDQFHVLFSQNLG